MQLNIISYNIEGLTLALNYCKDQSLKQYIINKSKYLTDYLGKLCADIICIQEYIPALNLDLENYYSVKENHYAIFFHKDKFKYVSHKFNEIYGLSIVLDHNGFIMEICTNRLQPYDDNKQSRANALEKIDTYAKDKIFIYAVDTNMKKSEEKILDNLVDTFYIADKTVGFYTFDKKENPYFFGDKEKITRTRYDKIFCSNLFECDKVVVLRPKPTKDLVHTIYPFGNISDHFPIRAELIIGAV